MAPLVDVRCSLITHDNYCSLLYVAENKLVVVVVVCTNVSEENGQRGCTGMGTKGQGRLTESSGWLCGHD